MGRRRLDSRNYQGQGGSRRPFGFLSGGLTALLSFFCVSLSWGAWGAERPAEIFILCSQKRATGLSLRTIIVHHIPEEGKCAAVYSREGKSQALAYGKWLGSCLKMADAARLRLENSLWDCGEHPSAQVFYSDQGGGKKEQPPS